MKFPKYSFVLPAFKATFLREALISILNQTYKDFELIIVNDASPEDLNSIVDSYHDERIQYYINEKNVGGHDLVAQWNSCISYAKGKYLILASDDDVYHLDFLEKMDVLIDKYPNVNVFRPRVQHMDANGHVRGESDFLDEYLSQIDFLYERYKGKVSSGLQYHIFNRNELVNIGGFVNFPTGWLSDDATVIRLAKNGVVSHKEALFAFRTSGLNISSKINDSKLMYYKLVALECFYQWFEREIGDIEVAGEDDRKKIASIVSNHSRNVMLEHMEGVIQGSDLRAVLQCWFIIHRIKSLSILERMAICCRVYKRKVINKLRK